MRVVPRTRPLLFHDGRLFCSQYNRIVATDDLGKTFREEGTLEFTHRLRPVLGLSALAQRVVRAGIYRMRVLPNGNRLYLFLGGIYLQKRGSRTADRTWIASRGSRPVSLAVGADGYAVFGEYWGNDALEEVRVIGSRDGGETWQTAFTFRPGEVRHVHGITYDPWENCYWICAGDIGDQNRLLRASADFREVRVVRQGGQGNRFFALLVTPNEVVTATDTPIEDNYVCRIDKRTGELEQLARIENSNFFSCIVNESVFVSTNAEPSEVNDTSACHVWTGPPAGAGWRRVLSLPVDLLTKLSRVPAAPQGLFQYPQVFFPEGQNPGGTLVFGATGLRGLDGAMICYDADDWKL